VMPHQRWRRASAFVAVGALGAVIAASGVGTASAGSAPSAVGYVTDPAALVNPFIGTSGGVDTFPGVDMPFGMMQWSPDTSPDVPAGGGYEYNDTNLKGFSLTHISGPGCYAYGDLPILPTVGAVNSPDHATASFSHAAESAQPGYYGVALGNGVSVRLTDATHSGIGTFDFPAGTQSNLLFKLDGSEQGPDATSAHLVGDDEIAGTVTNGHFCGAPTSWENDYTLHFDVKFSQPFTASGTWGGTAGSAVHPGARGVHSARSIHGAPAAVTLPRSAKPSSVVFAGARPSFTVRQRQEPVGPVPAGKAAVTDPSGIYVTFDTTTRQTVSAKVGISFTSDANAALNLRTEIPGWNFDAVRAANHNAWNKVLGAVQIGGGDHAAQVEFYTALYHALLHPNVFSDVNGQYMGYDDKVHTTAKGHAQYANYSGWDIYRSQVQLMAMVAPRAASDEVTSMLNDFAQTGVMPKWALANGESYMMVGDPADGIIGDAYAFGARGFDTKRALADMIHEATVANTDRPGLSLINQYGYIPYDANVTDCCRFYGPVSTQQEYDVADYAIASFAKSTGHAADYTRFATLAQSWQNVFNPSTGYLQARLTNGQFKGDFTPATGDGFVEATSAQYTPMINFNLKAMIAAKGGDAAYNAFLDNSLGDLTNPNSVQADLSNEPSVEIPWEYDYTGEPYKTQAIVREAQQQLYFDAPVGQDGNDDLGEMSSWYVWSELGMYPQVAGTDTLVLGSPVFPKALIHLGNGRTISIVAPNAMPGTPYVRGLTLNGHAEANDWLTFGQLSKGATLDYDLSSTPNTRWASKAANEPPSDATGERTTFAGVSPGMGLVVAPGATASAKVTVTNLGNTPETVHWSATATGVTLGTSSGSVTAAAHSTATAPLTVTAGGTEGSASVAVTFGGAASSLPPATLPVFVAKPGELWPYYTDEGVWHDGVSESGTFDGEGWSYSAQALAAAGVTAGGTVSSDGVNYPWPNLADGAADNIQTMGQTIDYTPPAGSTKLGLLGSATNAGPAGATFDLTVTYTDGSTQRFPLAISDWTLDAGNYQLLPDEHVAARTAYRDTANGGRDTTTTYLYAVDVPLAAGRTVASVTLPYANGGNLHVFAIGGN
jgi:predicted alpha-1,2-mannosidase